MVATPAVVGIEVRVGALGCGNTVEFFEVGEQALTEHAVELAAAHDDVGVGHGALE